MAIWVHSHGGRPPAPLRETLGGYVRSYVAMWLCGHVAIMALWACGYVAMLQKILGALLERISNANRIEQAIYMYIYIILYMYENVQCGA